MWDAYILDKDGTLVHQGTPIDGARHFLHRLHADQTPYVVLSNTGVHDSAHVAGDLTRVLGIEVRYVYTARDGMHEALRTAQFARVIDVGECGTPDVEDASGTCLTAFTDGEVADFCKTVTMVGAWLARGAHLWITSDDATVATTLPDGTVVRRPGPGVFLDAVRAVVPSTFQVRVFGKAHDPGMAREAMRMLREQGYTGSARGVCVVGDRYDTDVRAGVAHGWSTCLVESGCHTENDSSLFPEDAIDAVADSVRDLAIVKHTPSLVQTVVREVLRHAPRTQPLAHLLAERLVESSRRLDGALGAKPKRIRSCPERMDAM